VSGTYDDVGDEVSGVRITSEAGLPCVLFTPWPNRAVAPGSVSVVQESPGGGGGGDKGDDAHGVAINIPVRWDADRPVFRFNTTVGGTYVVAASFQQNPR
jgi:hypothetical protein